MDHIKKLISDLPLSVVASELPEGWDVRRHETEGVYYLEGPWCNTKEEARASLPVALPHDTNNYFSRVIVQKDEEIARLKAECRASKATHVVGTETGDVRVVDTAGDGTGPWKLFVGAYGVACWPSKSGVEEPKEYAEAVAKGIRFALADKERGPLRSEGAKRPCYCTESPCTECGGTGLRTDGAPPRACNNCGSTTDDQYMSRPFCRARIECEQRAARNASLAVGCPWCEVLPGVPCMDKDGVRAVPHKARDEKARAAVPGPTRTMANETCPDAALRIDREADYQAGQGTDSKFVDGMRFAAAEIRRAPRPEHTSRCEHGACVADCPNLAWSRAQGTGARHT
jgi:hypothetical protein